MVIFDSDVSGGGEKKKKKTSKAGKGKKYDPGPVNVSDTLCPAVDILGT